MFTQNHYFKQNPIENLSDKELVRLLIDNSRTAFGELYVRYKGRLTYFCKRFLKEETSIEDLLQDIFIQIWETRDSLNPELSISAYLHTLTQNRILNMFRQFDVHSRFAKHILKNQIETTNQTEDELIYKDYAEFLNHAMEILSPKQKEVFQLSRIQGLSYKEIADLLQISVPTVQEHASLALRKIKNSLIQHADIYFKSIITILLLIQ